MSDVYANEFGEIPVALAQNDALRQGVLRVVADEPMPGKVTESGDRLSHFRNILKDLVENDISLLEACNRVEMEIPRESSPYSASNRVFAAGWAERLVRTQLSRCYNQAVMEKLLAEGETECFVPHSAAEAADSPCSLRLAGAKHRLEILYARLVESYGRGNWTSSDVKIPNHPHCTHVVISMTKA